MERSKSNEILSILLNNVLVSKFRKQYLYYLVIKTFIDQAKILKKNSKAIKATVKTVTRKNPWQSLFLTFGVGLLAGGIVRRIRSK